MLDVWLIRRRIRPSPPLLQPQRSSSRLFLGYIRHAFAFSSSLSTSHLSSNLSLCLRPFDCMTPPPMCSAASSVTTVPSSIAASTTTPPTSTLAPTRPFDGQLITGSWDKTLKCWDPRGANGQERTPFRIYAKPERVYSLSLVGNRLVVATAGRHVNVYDLRNMSQPEQRRESSLKFQT
ncbi:hypothetical protein ACLB2K_015740 [Fragaria x ananassa]